LRPITNIINGSVGQPIDLSVLHINCANPNSDVVVTVDPGDETVTLLDDGTGPDQAPGDGIYSGQWTPPFEGNYTLTFSSGDVVKVSVNTPLLTVTPSSQDFGAVYVNSSTNKNFTIKNDGLGTLSGSASTNAPYSIVSGGSYNLSAGQSQTVTVR